MAFGLEAMVVWKHYRARSLQPRSALQCTGVRGLAAAKSLMSRAMELQLYAREECYELDVRANFRSVSFLESDSCAPQSSRSTN